MPLVVIEWIAARLKRRFEGIDLQVYANGKTLRCTGSHKLDKAGLALKSTILYSPARFEDTLITYIADEAYMRVDQPICIQNRAVLQFD